MARGRVLLRLRPTIVGWFVGLLCATVLAIGSLAYVETGRALEQLVDQHLNAVADVTESEVQQLLEPAPRLLEEAALLFARDRMPREPKDLGEVFVERMRPYPSLGWLGYADAAEHSFTGGTRAKDGSLRYNRSAAHVDGGVPTEMVVHPDGRFEPVQPSSDKPYDPTTRDWFAAAVDDPQLRWLEPYEFSSGEWGISVTRGVERDGEVVGVLLADFFLADVTAYLAGIRVAETGRVLLVLSEGAVLGAGEDDPYKTAAAATGSMTIDDRLHRVLRRPIRVEGGLAWDVVIAVPEAELTGVVQQNARRTLMLGLIALLAAMVFAVWFASAITRPIRALSGDITRVAALDLTPRQASPSLIHEVAVMAEAFDTMKAGLSSFSRYVPVDLVRQLLAQGTEARLGGETRELTLLFSDIEGFTPLVESTPPDVVLDALGTYLEHMNVAIGDSRGSVVQYLGDGLLAMWGAPVPDADHAVQACRAALAMRAASDALLEAADREGGVRLPTRIGVNTGEVLVGNIGAPTRFNYAAVGDPVNTASRIEGLNKQYRTQVLIGERTAELVADQMVKRPIDVVRMKGKRRPIRVYELVGVAGEVPHPTVEAVRRHAQAFETYLDRDFEGARAGFEAVHSMLGDAASEVLAARCRAFLTTPPAEDWDGTFVMTTK